MAGATATDLAVNDAIVAASGALGDTAVGAAVAVNVFTISTLATIGLTLFAYWLFGKALKAPLERGLLWF